MTDVEPREWGERGQAKLRCDCGRGLVLRVGRTVLTEHELLESLTQNGERRITCSGCRTVWLVTLMRHGDRAVVADAMDCGRL